MAFTDMPPNPTDALPWWARQGGPSGGPGAAPQGGGGANWLQYLQQMFGQGGAPGGDQQPYQVAGPMMGLSPGYDQAARLAAHRVSPASFSITDQDGNPVDAGGHGDGPPPPPPPVVAGPRPPAPVVAPPAPQQGPPGYLNSTGATPPPVGGQAPGYLGSTGAGSGNPRAQDAAMNQMTGMAPGVVNPGYRPPGIVPGRAPVAGPLAVPAGSTGGATGQGATSNPRFVPIDRPNMDPRERGSGRASVPTVTALNLAGLFGGQPSTNAQAVNPNVPAADAQPVSATRRVPGPLATTKAPWGYGPVQKGRSWPQGPDLPEGYRSSVARARILAPNYYS